MYARVRQSDNTVNDGEAPYPARHSGRKRCVGILVCLVLAAISGVVAPMLVSVIQLSREGEPVEQLEGNTLHDGVGEANLNVNERDEEKQQKEDVELPQSEEVPPTNAEPTNKQSLRNEQKTIAPTGQAEEGLDEDKQDVDIHTKNYDNKETSSKTPSTINPLMEKYTSKCTTWSKDIHDRFAKECVYWLPKFAEWENSLQPSTPSAAYRCDNQASCNGWGDRVGGLQSGFHLALETGRKFQVTLNGIHELLSPCLFSKVSAKWSKLHDEIQPSRDCVPKKFSCDVFGTHPTCRGGTMVARDAILGCLKDRHCDGIQRIEPNYNLVNMFGCGLRAMFEPTPLMMQQTRFPFRIGGWMTSKQMTLDEIHTEMRKYFVIAIHARLGDSTAFSRKSKGLANDQKGYYYRMPRCAMTIESYLRESNDARVDGKEIRWLLASDTEDYKEMIWDKFGDKMMAFTFTPEHLAFHGAGNNQRFLANEIAEWLTIGVADELVVNRLDRRFPDIYQGRISGFSSTSWIYNLKHMVHDALTCHRYTIPLENGIYRFTAKGENSCARGSVLKADYFGKDFPQPHLDVLWNNNKDFPDHYVFEGITYSGNTDFHKKLLSENEEEDAQLSAQDSVALEG